jgi:hypothetical protein
MQGLRLFLKSGAGRYGVDYFTSEQAKLVLKVRRLCLVPQISCVVLKPHFSTPADKVIAVAVCRYMIICE